MFDRQKAKQLEQRSHNRGLLSKQLYHSDQVELQRKRRLMKMELDRQVEENRRQKDKQRQQQQLKMKREEEQISNYYKNLQNRQKKMSINSSYALTNMKDSNLPYQTYPNQNKPVSNVDFLQQKQDNYAKFSSWSEPQIPLLPVMPSQQNLQVILGSKQAKVLISSKQNLNKLAMGSVPLLDYPEDSQFQTANFKKVKNNQQSKRQKTVEINKEYSINRKSQQQTIQFARKQPKTRQDSRTALKQQQDTSIVQDKQHAYIKQEFDHQQIKQEITVVQNQNQSLKQQLKKSQEAISLLLGAARSNQKLDVYRAKAEKILTAQKHQDFKSCHKQKQEGKNQQQKLMLPKIAVKHQSFLNDYLIAAAHRNKKLK